MIYSLKVISKKQFHLLAKFYSPQVQAIDQIIIQMQYKIPIFKILSFLLLTLSIQCCGTFTNVPKVAIGNYNPICIAVYYNTSTTANKYIEYYFKTKIDELSSLQLTNISTLFTNVTAANATVYYQNISTTFILVNSTQKVIRRFVSMVINVGDGVASSIAGDNFCDSSCSCWNSECYETYSGTGGLGTTDIVLYTSWAGSDESGTILKSSTMRLSRYSLYSVSSVSNQMKEYLNTLTK